MKNIRFALRLLATLLLRYKLVVAIGFLMGIFFFFFLPKVSKFLPVRKPTESIGLIGRFQVAEIPLEIQNKISYGLTQLEADGTPYPGVASNWQIDESQKSYTFSLKENVFWHDKSPLIAKDINYNFQDVTIEVIDDQSLKFNLKEPFSPLPEVLSKPIFKKGLIGLGPYKVTKLTKNGQLVESLLLESLAKDKPNLRYRFYPTEEAAKIALKLGEIRKLADVNSPEGFAGWKDLKISSKMRQDRFVGLFLNTQKPYLEEKNFRQALAYATPKEQGEKRALGPISPLSWAYSDEVKLYNYDLANAKKLLANVIEKKEIVLKLSTVPSLLSEAEKIKKAWKDLGIKVEITAFTQVNEDFDVLLATQQIPQDPDQYTLWHSTQGGNITHFKSLRIDKLLEDGRKTIDKEGRRKIYYDFQRFLVEEAPVIFLYHPTSFEITKI